ncbi:hypothetical protein C8R44DRAFT_236775 [Mycena epipterygia]|nr:hypothetical protein C8R44DRAFT_236775 [Mycena epipterygia]
MPQGTLVVLDDLAEGNCGVFSPFIAVGADALLVVNLEREAARGFFVVGFVLHVSFCPQGFILLGKLAKDIIWERNVENERGERSSAETIL